MSTQTDEIQNLRHAFASPAESAAPREGCPEPADLWRAASGESAGAQLREMVDHTAECAACAQAWRLARDMHSAAGQGTGLRAARSWRPELAAVAAAVVLAIGLGPQLLRQTGTDTPSEARFRGEEQEPIVSLVTDRLPREQCVLRWSTIKGAVYDLQVSTEELNSVLVARGLTTSEFRIPVAKLLSIPRDGTLLWRVEAKTTEGDLASPTFATKID